ncbi:Histone-lysine N-methyltransferase, H3 lysine-9 specific SUVH5 [Vitis vinifera]|uniref:Histone-lysine N-methyltransferase, H3 lysine-9 specific SUVH5 n=1 Tax=Vitis vinifera TaxID=29760 RepID=A0A438IN34_VITVI|nr:Histone-lysine N-methyltransferase, H3 lysine-9 specific SUVH5 [Vitis vinifera]
MVLSIPGTSTLKPPKKRPFENHVHHQYQSFPPKFRRPKVDAVRDWPRLCGKFTPPTDSNVIGDNIAFGTAGNLQAPVANGFKSASSSTNKNSASEKFNAEPRPLEIIETCPKSLGREMRGGRAFNGALERSSYEESNEVKRKIGGEVGETSGAVGEWVGDAKEVCILLGQEIQVGDSFQSALERSSCKETGNEIQNNFGGDVAETYKVEVKCGVDAKKMCTSLGQVKQGGGTCNRALKRSPWEATINEFWDKFGDVGETSGLLTFGNKAGRGKSVLRSIGKEVEICSKDQSSMDHQTIVNNSRVQGALNLFQELLEKLTHEASLTMKKVIISKLHVEAAMTLKRQQKWVNTTKRLGHVPEWHRLHGERWKILAISIVDSGRYANDKESSDILIYSGQGGNPMVGHKQAEDQKLERGNLALKNSMDAKLLELNKPKKSKVRMKTILNDISQGKEERPIRVVNTIDDEKPQPFSYIARMVYLESSNWSIPSGCDCTDGCSDSVKCACVLKNGGEIPFNCSGAIIEAKPWIYECGPLCKCPPSCNNRVSQNGIRFPLEVFKTKSTGWGVRSRNYIPSGSFICEYAGELIQDKEAEQRVAKDYGAFAIDAAKFANVGRFFNHSCSPNLYAQNVLYDHDDKRMPHIMLFATKNIPPMRELMYDYNYMVGQVRDINGKIKKKRCYCGSRECTGRMY